MNRGQGERRGLGADAAHPDMLALLDKEERDPFQQRKYAIRHRETGRYLKATSGSQFSVETRIDGADYYMSDLPDISTRQGCGIRMKRFKHPEAWEVVEIGFKVIRYTETQTVAAGIA